MMETLTAYKVLLKSRQLARQLFVSLSLIWLSDVCRFFVASAATAWATSF